MPGVASLLQLLDKSALACTLVVDRLAAVPLARTIAGNDVGIWCTGLAGSLCTAHIGPDLTPATAAIADLTLQLVEAAKASAGPRAQLAAVPVPT